MTLSQFCRILNYQSQGDDSMKQEKHGQNISIIRKPSALLAQSTHNISLSQRKFYNLLLHVGLKEITENPNKRIFKVKIKDLKTDSGIGNTNYDRIKDDVVALAKTNVFYNLFNKSRNDYSNWITFNLLAHARKVEESIEFSLPEPVLELIKDPDVFALLNNLIMKNLKKKYSLILYELFEDYKSVEIPKMTIDNLRSLFGLNDDQYPNFYDLEKRCIKPAIDEINEKTGIKMEYKKLPEGAGKTTHIKFICYSGPALMKKIFEETKTK